MLNAVFVEPVYRVACFGLKAIRRRDDHALENPALPPVEYRASAFFILTKLNILEHFHDQANALGNVEGLGGEIRSVAQSTKRVAEARKLGFTKALAPATKSDSTFIQPIKNLRQALIDYLK